ncbi:MAG: helix-turn-helix domain-containing protein [Oligoflexia bacterium]|nr:helix-turn-helix domain-containing protein [Oligoflexia bacterium]
MSNTRKQSLYEILDVSFNASPDTIRHAYIKAKNAYNRDSLAAYSLYSAEESKDILSEIEEAYTILSDVDSRKKYDDSHGIISSDSYNSSYRSSSVTFSKNEAREEITSASTEYQSSSTTSNAPTATAGNMSHIDRILQTQESKSANPVMKNYLKIESQKNDPEMEERINKCENVSGGFLRSVREYKNVTLDQMIDILKISKNYLTALEEDQVEKLPANVFVRGFVIQYARALKLNHEKVSSSYMEFLKNKRPSL